METLLPAASASLVGRVDELRILGDAFRSGRAEFIAVYGRRRIGKTFLVRRAFGDRFAFHHTGLSKIGMAGQLAEFARSLEHAFGRAFPPPSNWFDAFDALRGALQARRGRKVLFLDELPWMDTPKSGFLPALEHFWNGWASGRPDILLVVCGSAASWIVDKLIDDYGGLHDRLTHRIRLLPFSLAECRAFSRTRGLALSSTQLARLYMAFGGIPWYWDLLRRGESPDQAIDRLCFAENGELRGEFDRLYASLFRKPDPHLAIVSALARKTSGLDKADLLSATGLPDNGRFTAALDALENCGFIRRFAFPGKKIRNSLWQLLDPFTLFHFRFLSNPAKLQRGNWIAAAESPARLAWSGLAFEQLCLLHVPQIKRALGISGVAVDAYACRLPPGPDGEPGAQIDLVLDRADGIVDLCEMKFTRAPFVVSAECRTNLLEKIDAFRRTFKSRKAIHVVFVSSAGLRPGIHSDVIQTEIRLEDLFQ